MATPSSRDALYDACYAITRSHPEHISKTFDQEELLALDIINTNRELMEACQALMDRQLMRMMVTEARKTVWCLRTREVAKKYRIILLSCLYTGFTDKL